MRHLDLLARVTASLSIVAAVTAFYVWFLPANPTTIALSYVVAILLIATPWGIVEASAASLAAVFCFNFFFLPPAGTLTIADPQNWAALVAFLLTAIVASQLSGRARQRTMEAMARQRDLERLYALSRALLLSESGPAVPAGIARHLADTFELSAVALFDRHTETVAHAGSFDLPGVEATLRDVTEHGTVLRRTEDRVVMEIRLGGAPIGALALAGADVSDTVLQSMASLIAIGLERARGQEAAARAEAARQSGELRATVLDALAHEFKTPLTSIKAAASSLLDTLPAAAPDRELAVIVDEETDRLEFLVTDAVRMLRIEAGGFTLRRERQHLSTLIASALGDTSARLDGHPVVSNVPDNLIIDADGELLRLAIRQLLDNAVKYSPPTSTIALTASLNARVEIAVRNSGSLIPEREQARIFERFFRGAGARHVPGTGMGLAIVRQIAEAHGGTLTVSSTRDDGTEFRLSLPAGEPS